MLCKEHQKVFNARKSTIPRDLSLKAYFAWGFAKGSPYNVLLMFFQSYVEYDLRKNKIVIPFFC
jgi:hypothetical protein